MLTRRLRALEKAIRRLEAAPLDLTTEWAPFADLRGRLEQIAWDTIRGPEAQQALEKMAGDAGIDVRSSVVALTARESARVVDQLFGDVLPDKPKGTGQVISLGPEYPNSPRRA